MTEEQMERLARYATDKYIDSLTEENKKYLMMSKENFMKSYISTFELALSEVKKKESSNFQEFGIEENSKMFK